MFPTVAALSG